VYLGFLICAMAVVGLDSLSKIVEIDGDESPFMEILADGRWTMVILISFVISYLKFISNFT
jgi:hypothetical protein